jgi:hypothetical protein
MQDEPIIIITEKVFNHLKELWEKHFIVSEVLNQIEQYNEQYKDEHKK